jgi:hypothetical protein
MTSVQLKLCSTERLGDSYGVRFDSLACVLETGGSDGAVNWLQLRQIHKAWLREFVYKCMMT